MRKALLLIGLLSIAAAAVLLLGGHEGEAGRAPRSDPGDYRPSATLSWLGNVVAVPLAPSLELPGPSSWRIRPGAPQRLAVPASDERFRIARFRHLGGGPLRLSYDCGIQPRGADSKTCRDQLLCLGATATPPVAGCDGALASDGRLMILENAGTLTLEAVGAEAVVAMR
jgi:hypothetical protein